MIIEGLIVITLVVCIILAIVRKSSAPLVTAVTASIFLAIISWAVSAGIAPMTAPFSCGNVLESHELQVLGWDVYYHETYNGTVDFRYDDNTFCNSSYYVLVDINETDISEPTVFKCTLKHSPWVSLFFQYVAPDYYVIVAPKAQTST